MAVATANTRNAHPNNPNTLIQILFMSFSFSWF
jgi:hypothetical protein